MVFCVSVSWDIARLSNVEALDKVGKKRLFLAEIESVSPLQTQSASSSCPNTSICAPFFGGSFFSIFCRFNSSYVFLTSYIDRLTGETLSCAHIQHHLQLILPKYMIKKSPKNLFRLLINQHSNSQLESSIYFLMRVKQTACRIKLKPPLVVLFVFLAVWPELCHKKLSCEFSDELHLRIGDVSSI